MVDENLDETIDRNELPRVPLPGVVTAISLQKKHKDRYSIFVDDYFLIGVSTDTLLQVPIKKGDVLTPERWDELCLVERKYTVKSWLLSMLGRRAHGKKELRVKAIQKGFHPPWVDEFLEEMEEKNWINDGAFARSFARDKYLLQRWGPKKIEAELQQKGIKGENVKRALLEVEDLCEEHGEEILIKLILKRKHFLLKEKDMLKRQQKMIVYLQRKGYSYAYIASYKDTLMALLNTNT